MGTKNLVIVIVVTVLLGAAVGHFAFPPKAPAPIVIDNGTQIDTAMVSFLTHSNEVKEVELKKLKTQLALITKLTLSDQIKINKLLDSLATIHEADSINIMVASLDTVVQAPVGPDSLVRDIGRFSAQYLYNPMNIMKMDLWLVNWEPYNIPLETKIIYQAVPFKVNVPWYDKDIFRIPMEIGVIYATYKIARR